MTATAPHRNLTSAYFVQPDEVGVWRKEEIFDA